MTYDSCALQREVTASLPGLLRSSRRTFDQRMSYAIPLETSFHLETRLANIASYITTTIVPIQIAYRVNYNTTMASSSYVDSATDS